MNIKSHQPLWVIELRRQSGVWGLSGSTFLASKSTIGGRKIEKDVVSWFGGELGAGEALNAKALVFLSPQYRSASSSATLGDCFDSGCMLSAALNVSVRVKR